MKAKEYAAQFNESPSFETLSRIGFDFIHECKDIAAKRNAQSDAAMFAIFEEQDRKWKALARLIDGIKPNGFELLLQETMPDVWRMWHNSKST